MFESSRKTSRRRFLQLAASLYAGLNWPRRAAAQASKGDALPEPTAAKLPQWHGFNLLSKFMVAQSERFPEDDFAWIAELGFNFVRLPMDYRCWVEPDDWTEFREDVLKEIDEAVGFGDKHGIHVCLNFHRAPGYTVASPAEEKELWSDEEAQKACALHWGTFAERYKGIPNRRLSFNLFNEPALVAPDAHRDVVEKMLEAIRKHDEERLVICDGRMWARTPPTELLGLGVAAATRGYEPMRISHYKAGWVKGADAYPLPTYPMDKDGVTCNAETLRQRCIEPWKELEAKGMGVMVGEFGAYNKTPHDVVVNWMRDFVALWKEAGWGYAMWNFRGPFGILDSDREDVAYESWHEHKLDRALLDVVKPGMP